MRWCFLAFAGGSGFRPPQENGARTGEGGMQRWHSVNTFCQERNVEHRVNINSPQLCTNKCGSNFSLSNYGCLEPFFDGTSCAVSGMDEAIQNGQCDFAHPHPGLAQPNTLNGQKSLKTEGRAYSSVDQEFNFRLHLFNPRFATPSGVGDATSLNCRVRDSTVGDSARTRQLVTRRFLYLLSFEGHVEWSSLEFVAREFARVSHVHVCM